MVVTPQRGILYSTLERAPAMPKQACFRHIEAIIPTDKTANRRVTGGETKRQD